MTNKEMIKKLKDNAELAWASYGYFHLADKNYKPHRFDKDGRKLQYFREKIKKDDNATPTPTDILNINYKYYKDDNGNDKNGLLDDAFLGGDMSTTQAQNFFQRYDLLIHQPNTSSGFLATF